MNTLAGEQCDDRGECPDTTPCTVGDPSGATNTCGDPLDCAPDDDDGCNLVCITEFCGDGITQTGIGEECDPNGPADSATCNSAGSTGIDPNGLADPNVDLSCQDAECGDGYLNTAGTEECDDGCLEGLEFSCTGVDDNDGCRSDCILESCGDGISQTSEACDDGNNVDGDDCSANCQSDETCGNSTTDDLFPDPNDNETCDDGNTIDSDDCSNDCQDRVCGNGIQPCCGNNPVPANECDDGNAVIDDGCTNDCKLDPDQDGAPAGADVCAATSLADKRLLLNKLDQTGGSRIAATGTFVPEPNEPDVTNTGVSIELRNGTTVLYDVCIAGNQDAPGGEYLRLSTTPACGDKRDGWTSKVTNSGAKFQYKNKTGLAPAVGNVVDGTCTGSTEGVRRVFLKDLGNGTWKYKIDIRDIAEVSFDDPANDGSQVLGKLQLQLAFENCLGGSPTSAGTAGQCLDLQFDQGSCAVKTGFGGLRKVVCK